MAGSKHCVSLAHRVVTVSASVGSPVSVAALYAARAHALVSDVSTLVKGMISLLLARGRGVKMRYFVVSLVHDGRPSDAYAVIREQCTCLSRTNSSAELIADFACMRSALLMLISSMLPGVCGVTRTGNWHQPSLMASRENGYRCAQPIALAHTMYVSAMAFAALSAFSSLATGPKETTLVVLRKSRSAGA
jgi:hypothetical protein